MNRTTRLILAVVFIAIIMFCAISISQGIFKRARFDITDQKLYTLSDGTKAILAKLNQPVKLKLYYTKTAAMKGPDQIRFFNNYYYFVESLLNEYVAKSGGMVQLEVIDPRPFTDDEADALRYGLRRIPMSEEESFIFGLVAQTQFGVTKSIPLFSPDRQRFVEYDISELIDNAIRRQKKNIGVISSLPVMGEQISGYMAQMMAAQGRRPPGPWTIIEQIQQKYDVRKIETDVHQINDIDILLVIHPKNLPEKTLFAIDQFVLNGGRTIVFVDPYCFSDRPRQQMAMMQPGQSSSSSLEPLLAEWGLEMPENTFAGDRSLALLAPIGPNQRPQRLIGLLDLTGQCFNKENVITANLNEVRVLFAGALQPIEPTDTNETSIERTPIMSTTARGNTWSPDSPYELMMPQADRLMSKFTDGFEPVHMGYLVTGRFKSAFPQGIKIKNESDPNSEPNTVTGLTEAAEDCAVAVFSDVDLITDNVAYTSTFFGKLAVADNATLVLNAIDELTGSAELISIRSRGTFTRPFEVVDKIEQKLEKGTAEEERKVNAEIASFQQELNQIVSSAKEDQQEVIGSSILKKKKELELKIHDAQTRLVDLNRQKRQSIEKLGNTLRDLNTLPGPVFILVVAVVLGIWRSTKKRHYISHTSDA